MAADTTMAKANAEVVVDTTSMSTAMDADADIATK
jgi:hypothetical protein